MGGYIIHASLALSMFFSAIESLEKFIHRSENINSAYTKYKDSAFTLGKALTDASSTLQVISGHW